MNLRKADTIKGGLAYRLHPALSAIPFLVSQGYLTKYIYLSSLLVLALAGTKRESKYRERGGMFRSSLQQQQQQRRSCTWRLTAPFPVRPSEGQHPLFSPDSSDWGWNICNIFEYLQYFGLLSFLVKTVCRWNLHLFGSDSILVVAPSEEHHVLL